MNLELEKKFLPDVLQRKYLPMWFIQKAEEVSEGKLEYIVFDPTNKDIIYAELFYEGEYYETIVFQTMDEIY